jgi:glutamyl-tRNA synthetase
MAAGGAPIYRGRLAPTPSGFLHLGHARTFWTAFERAQAAAGVLIYRDEDLDPDRCRAEFAAAAIEDLHWLGITWQEGPDIGGPHAPYKQSERLDFYREVWHRLHATGRIYPSPHSRKDVQEALLAPHDDIAPRDAGTTGAVESPTPLSPGGRGAGGEGELRHESTFPINLRPPAGAGREATEPGAVNWRFRVPDEKPIAFTDLRVGRVERIAGRDFGDFIVWRKDGFPSYELAVVADDHAMQITEVVRGEDLLTSTARQLLLYRALAWPPPAFYHCPLVTDALGQRLAKRNDALTIRTLRNRGVTPPQIRMLWTAHGE